MFKNFHHCFHFIIVDSSILACAAAQRRTTDYQGVSICTHIVLCAQLTLDYIKLCQVTANGNNLGILIIDSQASHKCFLIRTLFFRHKTGID